MLNHPDVRAGKVDLRSLKICVSGSAPLLADTKRQFEDRTGARLVEGYALTESMMAACLNPIRGVTKLGSVGLPLPDVDVQVVDAETGAAELPVGDVGELIMHAPQHMLEYWEDQAETATALHTRDDGLTWLYTGDLAYIDPDGYVFLVDRKKDMVKTSGFQVWPREIEEVLASHPAVREAGVAGTPDPVRGEVTHAWVVIEDGQEATEEELRAYCRERLAPYKVPVRIHFRTELPKTQVGKILRRVLAAELTA
jgi:long-chain acyl-CoA synthetase